VLAYKFLTYPASSVFESQYSAALHYYFGGGFQVSEFRDWHEFWSIALSNPDVQRGMDQLTYVGPFYGGVGYSVAAWIGRRTELNRRLADVVRHWRQSRPEQQT
jgi:hypothetical protein